MTDHDRLFKELLTTFFVEFLELFFPEVLTYLDTEQLEFIDKELFTNVTSGDTYEADIIAKAPFRNQPTFFIIHVEHQAQPCEGFNLRMYRYFALLHFKHGLPIYPIALFSDKSARRDEPDTYQVAFPDLEVLNFRYRVIQLRRLNWHDFATRDNPIASALLSKMGMKHSERPKVLLTSLRLLAHSKLDKARQRLISGFIDTYLRLTEEEQAQFEEELAHLTPTEQEATMELTTSWKEEGLREGRQLGIQEGFFILIQHQLRRRVGQLPAEMEERIKELSLVQQQTLAEDLLDFIDLADVQAWLDAHLPSKPSSDMPSTN